MKRRSTCLDITACRAGQSRFNNSANLPPAPIYVYHMLFFKLQNQSHTDRREKASPGNKSSGLCTVIILKTWREFFARDLNSMCFGVCLNNIHYRGSNATAFILYCVWGNEKIWQTIRVKWEWEISLASSLYIFFIWEELKKLSRNLALLWIDYCSHHLKPSSVMLPLSEKDGHGYTRQGFFCAGASIIHEECMGFSKH